MMLRSIWICLWVLSPAIALAQNPWDAWDAEAVRELNTAVEAEYLNEEEKKAILFMNMARYDGPLFARTFLEVYVKEHQVKNSSYLRSLQKDLNRTEGLMPLQPERDLTAVAQAHALKSGQTGRVGHQDFNQRFEPLLGNPYMQVGENCSYGFETAIDIVLSLLIDEGVKDKGHRQNILSKDFNSIGIAIRPHKTYRVNCVMDFGRRDRSGLNQVPY